MTNPKTPSQRKAEARVAVMQWPMTEEKLDAYVRACIDEAVAPIADYIDSMDGTRLAEFDRKALRKLLTERAGT